MHGHVCHFVHPKCSLSLSLPGQTPHPTPAEPRENSQPPADRPPPLCPSSCVSAILQERLRVCPVRDRCVRGCVPLFVSESLRLLCRAHLLKLQGLCVLHHGCSTWADASSLTRNASRPRVSDASVDGLLSVCSAAVPSLTWPLCLTRR